MSREIKFRVWWTPGFGYPARWCNPGSMMIDGNGILHEIDYEAVPVDTKEHTVQFFIGLKDKNGKEIYEGDLVRITENDGKTWIGEIRWNHTGFSVMYDWPVDIGNKTELRSGGLPLSYFAGTYMDKLEVFSNIFESRK